MRVVFSPTAPPPNGHYSQGVVHNGVVYVSAQLPISSSGDVTPRSAVRRQAVQAFANVDAILRASGSSLAHVLSVTVYVATIESWGDVNLASAEAFGEHAPARAIVPVGQPLHLGYAVAVQAIAALA